MAWPHSPQRRSAFTLIEVLVVVAIMALLIAILVPSLRKARDYTKLIACQANLHDFGMAILQYTNASRGYQPLVCYVGTKIYEDDPTSDDNLIVLWMQRYTPNVGTYTCPATTHQVRKPERIDKVPVPGLGIRFDVYTAGQLRNDFEFHGQLVQEKLYSGVKVPVNRHGTSYEYKGWVGTAQGKSSIDWYPLNAHTSKFAGAPRTQSNVKQPWDAFLMKDADEGNSRGDVVGAPAGAATNNLPEPWDNHGKKLSNMLYSDGHVVAHPAAYWQKIAKSRDIKNY